MKKPNSNRKALKAYLDEVAGSENYKAFDAIVNKCPFSTRKARKTWLIKKGHSISVAEYIAKKYSTR